MSNYTIGFIKINEDEKEYPLYSVTISHEKDMNNCITFTKFLFKYYDNNALKEFSIKVTPTI